MILSVEETTSAMDVGIVLRPFHALRQPVQVTGCRGDFLLSKQR